MKSAQLDILNHIEKAKSDDPLLNQPPKTPQQRFLLTYAAIYFLGKGSTVPLIDKLMAMKTGSNSQRILKLKYMQQCMQRRVNLDNKDFCVLNTLMLWMEQLQKLNKNDRYNLINLVLLPHPHQLKFQSYEELIVYLNYLAVDIQNLFKGHSQWDSDSLITFLRIALPRIHHSIIVPGDLLSEKGSAQERHDILYTDVALEYFTRVKPNYRGLCKLILMQVVKMDLKTSQLRLLVDVAARYYMLFWNDPKQDPEQLFTSVFDKCSDPVKFSLTDELLLFFKISQKIGAHKLEKVLRSKCQWLDELLLKYKDNGIGHPKDDVNPFNPLGIKDRVIVEAGKNAERIIQIYQPQTLFYFSFLIKDNDINIRLYYLGDFEDKIQIKKLLNSEDKKSGEHRFAYLAAKRGIYKIEFDNSYSWINSKTVSFEYVVLAPQQTQSPSWLTQLLELNSTDFRQKQQESLPVGKKKDKQKPMSSVEQTPSKSESDIIQTHNLQEIYSSQKYGKGELKEESGISLNHQQKAKPQKIAIENLDFDDQPTYQIKEKQEINQKASSFKQGQPQQQTNLRSAELQDKMPSLDGLKSAVSAPPKVEALPVREQFRLATNFAGQANLSLIDSIFSLLVNSEDHTYQFETNLQDRITKRLRAYSTAEETFQWIVNSQARDWLKKNGFALVLRGGVNILLPTEKAQLFNKKASSKKGAQ